jgi:hypothetical protein
MIFTGGPFQGLSKYVNHDLLKIVGRSFECSKWPSGSPREQPDYVVACNELRENILHGALS